MIGKTNALAGGAKLKYASGTVTTAYTSSKTSGYHFLYLDVTGLDFQPIAAWASSSYSYFDSSLSYDANSVIFSPDNMNSVLCHDLDMSSVDRDAARAAKVFINSNIKENGFVLPMDANTDSYSSSNTYPCAWFAVGV